MGIEHRTRQCGHRHTPLEATPAGPVAKLAATAAMAETVAAPAAPAATTAGVATAVAMGYHRVGYMRLP